VDVNADADGHLAEPAQSVGELHLPRRPAFRLEQPRRGDKNGRAPPREVATFRRLRL
jgi:hypothetical protein